MQAVLEEEEGQVRVVVVALQEEVAVVLQEEVAVALQEGVAVALLLLVAAMGILVPDDSREIGWLRHWHHGPICS